jgi:alkylation response protein AidB-like acyl-CoA dehydrogenase
MIIDRRDFEFLFGWLDLASLLERERFSGQTVDDALSVVDLADQIASDVLAPHLRLSDTQEPSLQPDGTVKIIPEAAQALGVMAEAGMFSTFFDAEVGGLQLPHTVHVAALGTLMAGNLSTASFLLLTAGNAALLANYGSPAQVEAFVVPQVAGRYLGTMCLSEPHAGSSLADIRSRALPDGEDALGRRFRITGGKMWISAGDHEASENIVHLVLAKVPEADGSLPVGSKGISLFVVPKFLPDGQLNDVAVAGLNHKMGYRGLPNCALNFGEGRTTPDGAPGAVGWLLGDVGQGLPQMFHMMNEARVSVGLAATMLACRGYQMSLEYARTRTQGRHPGASPAEPQIPIIEHADVKRMLLTQKAYSQGALGLMLYAARLIDDEKTAPTQEERVEAGKVLAFLTPIVKTWPSEWGQASLHHALQIFGGAGYTRDFEIELLYRENRLNPIHEGTTGIQGIDLVGRKMRRENGESFALLAQRIRASIAAGQANGLADIADKVALALEEVERAVAALLAKADNAQALAWGTPMLFAAGHLVIGWIWLEQAIAASRMDGSIAGIDDKFIAARLRCARFFALTELPKIASWTAEILADSSTVSGADPDEF